MTSCENLLLRVVILTRKKEREKQQKKILFDNVHRYFLKFAQTTLYFKSKCIYYVLKQTLSCIVDFAFRKIIATTYSFIILMPYDYILFFYQFKRYILKSITESPVSYINLCRIYEIQLTLITISSI